MFGEEEPSQEVNTIHGKAARYDFINYLLKNILFKKACQDHNCSIALFGQAFTYEKSTSRETFLLNDDKLWYGDNFVRLFIPKENKWYIEVNKGQGWDVFYDQGMESEVAVL